MQDWSGFQSQNHVLQIRLIEWLKISLFKNFSNLFLVHNLFLSKTTQGKLKSEIHRTASELKLRERLINPSCFSSLYYTITSSTLSLYSKPLYYTLIIFTPRLNLFLMTMPWYRRNFSGVACYLWQTTSCLLLAVKSPITLWKLLVVKSLLKITGKITFYI